MSTNDSGRTLEKERDRRSYKIGGEQRKGWSEQRIIIKGNEKGVVEMMVIYNLQGY